jgi:hypothetical protein
MWGYGSVGLYFRRRDEGLNIIDIDLGQPINGGPSMSIDAWVLSTQLTPGHAVDALDRAQIPYVGSESRAAQGVSRLFVGPGVELRFESYPNRLARPVVLRLQGIRLLRRGEEVQGRTGDRADDLVRLRGCNFSMDWRLGAVGEAALRSCLADRILKGGGFAEHAEGFLDTIQAGDEIWEYDSPQECWRMGFGSLGYVLIRDGRAVRRLKLKFN